MIQKAGYGRLCTENKFQDEIVTLMYEIFQVISINAPEKYKFFVSFDDEVSGVLHLRRLLIRNI